jgi:hypothetical protein
MAETQAEDDARYMMELLEKGIPFDVAARMACTRVYARVSAKVLVDARKPPKEPWEK